MRLFAGSKPLTATIEADNDNEFWPEFKIHFKPAVGFEIADAERGGAEGKMDLLKAKLLSWEGLKADKESAAYLNTLPCLAKINRVIADGEDIPYHPDFLHEIHSVCTGIIWQKIAGYVRMSSRQPTAPQAMEQTAKN